jgi:hypothetical protein
MNDAEIEARRAKKEAERALRRRNLKQLTSQDVALASYPRSGNTWIRLCLVDLFHQLRGRETNPSMRRSIDRALPSLARVDISKSAEFIRGMRIYKTHRNEDLGDRRFVYIVRDPADCLRSYYRFLTKGHLDEAQPLGDFVDRMLPAWIAHVSEALTILKDDPMRAHFVAYEEMHKHPRLNLWRIAMFLGLPVGRKEIARAVENNSFEHSRARALNKGAENAEWNYGEGKIGLSAAMPPEIREKIDHEAAALYKEAANAAKASIKDWIRFEMQRFR